MLKKIWRALSGKSEMLVSQRQVMIVLSIVVGVYHACLLGLYAYHRMPILVGINIGSIIMYVACAVAAWLNVKTIHILRAFHVEVIIQVLSAGIMLGHQCGFQFYLIALTCLAFYTGYLYRDDEKINAMHYVLIDSVTFILLCLGYVHIPRLYAFRDERVEHALYSVNFFTAVIVIVLAMANLLSQIKHLEGRLLQKNKDLEVLSRTDALTGLANRRSIEEKYRYVMEHSKMFAIILADIDDFKSVNDTFGHNVGDKILQQVAEIFQSSVRGEDMVCRWGGEEILVFLPLCKKEGAELTANRILEKIRQARAKSIDGQDIHFFMTFGLADSSEGDDLRAVVQKADARLYEGKANGKNCVVCGSKKDTACSV